MIVYDLACTASHRFEGWFRDADDFERQRNAGLVACPVCGAVEVNRQPSAAHVHVAQLATRQADAGMPSPERQAMELLRRLVSSSEDVGRDFCEVARRIHYDEEPARSIRGQATQEQYEALREEGIDALPLPPGADPEKLM